MASIAITLLEFNYSWLTEQYEGLLVNNTVSNQSKKVIETVKLGRFYPKSG